jgi:hypothetical protein
MAAASAPHSGGASEGSTFTIRLPRASARRQRRRAKRAAEAAGKPAVLLIEDNEDGREMMATMLDAYGYPVLHAADGLQGVQLAWPTCRRRPGRHRPARHRRLRGGAPPARAAPRAIA